MERRIVSESLTLSHKPPGLLLIVSCRPSSQETFKAPLCKHVSFYQKDYIDFQVVKGPGLCSVFAYYHIMILCPQCLYILLLVLFGVDQSLIPRSMNIESLLALPKSHPAVY
jgi:hypothetical protein